LVEHSKKWKWFIVDDLVTYVCHGGGWVRKGRVSVGSSTPYPELGTTVPNLPR
jgi:hypothetical protein